MKKWLVAVVCIVALCLVACCAMADDYLTVTVSNATITNGAVSGSYYYKICLETNLDHFEMGWNTDTSASAPDPEMTYTSPVSRWYPNGGDNNYFIVTLPPEEGNDAMYYRISNRDPWQKIVFNYDRSKTGTASVTVSTNTDPTLFQDSYTVKWSKITSADAYIFHWGRDGEDETYTAPTNSITLTDQRYGGPEHMLGKVGRYNCYVDVLKGNKLLTTTAQVKQFTIKPELMLADYNEDFVQVNNDGSATVKLNQWVHYSCNAPGIGYVSMHALTAPYDENTVLDGSNEFGSGFTDENGWFDQQWIEVGYDADFDRYIVAQAYFGDEQSGYTVVSNCIPLHVERDETISGNITYTVPTDVNTKKNNKWQVPLDGRLFVDVTNDPDVDFYGLYIPGKNEGDPWIADSHWVGVSDGNTTRVPLTVPRCTVGQEYDVKVFAIKFGAPQKDAEDAIRIKVTAASSDSPVILSMADTFETGEPLRVFAHYTDPEHIEDGALQIRIVEKGNPENVVFEEMQGYDDFWNDGEVIWGSGTYVVEAEIWQYGNCVRTYENLKEITVTANGITTAPEAEKVATVPAGQNLVLNLSAPGTNDTVMPDWFDYALFRADWGHSWVTGGSGDIDQNGSGTVTIDKENLEAGGRYIIRLFSMKRGYDVGTTEFRFVVESAETAQSLQLWVNGSNNAEQEVYSSSNVHVKVDFTEDRPTAIRILNGQNWEYWWGEDNFERDWGFGDDELIMYAEATWDPINFDDLENSGWANFDWDRDVTWSARSNAIRLYVTSPFGVMVEPTFTLDNQLVNDEIPWGQDLIVSIQDEGPTGMNANGGQAQVIADGWFFCNLYIERADGYNTWWDHVNHNYNYNIRSGENHLPTYNLEGGCKYRLEIGADAEGYSGRAREVEFTLADRPEEQEPTKVFTVDGKSTDFSAQTHVDMPVVAYQSGAEWYDIEITEIGNYGWCDHMNESHDGILIDRWRTDHAGTFILKAFAYGHLRDEWGNIFEDENGRDTWEDEIGTIVVTATADHGDLGEMGVTMNDYAFVGDPLVITFDAVEHAEEYGYWIHSDYDNRWLMGENRNSPGTLTIDTSRLEPGVYWVELDAMAQDYNQSHATLHFALLDKSGKWSVDDARYYYVSSKALSVPTETDVRLVAYIPGAEAVRILCERNNDGDIHEISYRDGPGLTMDLGSAEAASLKFYLSGRSGEQWSEPVSLCTLTITAEHGQLAPLSVSVNGVALTKDGDGVPDVYAIPADGNNPHKLTVSMNQVTNAVDYAVIIRPFNDGWEIYNDQGPSRVVEIEDGRIEPGRVYELYCEVKAQGYNSSVYEQTFVLQEGASTGNVTLQITPTADDGFWTAEDVNVHAAAEGATAIKICMNNDDVRWYRGDTVDDRWGIWDTYTEFHAYATSDPIPSRDNFDWNELDLNWSMQSDLVTINAKTEGDTAVPSLTFDDHIMKGEWFVFTIGNDGDARQMDIRIKDEEGNEYEFRRYWAPGTYKITTANLEPNRRYQVTLTCVQDRRLWTNGPDQWLYVDAPQQAEAFFRIDKTELYVYEPFIPTVYAPNAEHIWITDENWDRNPNSWRGVWGDWDGDNGTNHADWEWWYDNSGEYILTAWAKYPDSDAITEIGSVDLTVSDPTRFANADIQVDNVLNVTVENYIDIPLVEHAYYYTLQLHHQHENGENWLRYEKTVNDAQNGKVTFTIPANTLIKNESYWIDCYLSPADRDYAFSGSDSSRNIMTTDGSAHDANIVVSVNDGPGVTFNPNGISIMIHTGFQVTVSRSADAQRTPTAVALFMGDQAQYQFFVENDGSPNAQVFGLNEYQTWPETIYARAFYGDMSSYNGWEDVPWETLDWGTPSVPVQVTFTSSGPAGQTDIDWAWGTIAGHDLIIRVNHLGEHAVEAHANLDRNTGGGWENLVFDRWIDWEEDPDHPGSGTITIPTEGLEPGQYRLYVDNSGPGYHNDRRTEWIWIVEDPYLSESKLVLPGGLTEIEEEAFMGIGADTVIIPDHVMTIGARAFADSNVRLVVIPESVTSIGPGAFSGSNLSVVYGYTETAMNCVNDYGGDAYCDLGE